MTERREIKTDRAPTPRAPYSQGIVCSGAFAFLSGQTPVDPATGTRVTGTFADQARRVFENLGAIAEAAGGTLANAVRVSVYLKDMTDFQALNEIYAAYFTGALPARTTIEVNLPGFLIEADAIIALNASDAASQPGGSRRSQRDRGVGEPG